MTATRRESDASGAVEIPADRLWGAQTQRALGVFGGAGPRLQPELLHAFGLQKAAAAEANLALGVLDAERAGLIRRAALEMADGAHDDQFPLPVFQTGSGTQTNMCANEVIANRANRMAGQPLGARAPVHPNDHVNRSQSSNDSFPTVMQIASVRMIEGVLLPGAKALAEAMTGRAAAFESIVRLGRTHLNDAVPVTLSQGFHGYARQIGRAAARLEATLPDLRELPQGGTAAGSGLNAPVGFDRAFCEALSALAGTAFTPSPVKVEAMAAHDALVAASAAMEGLAVALVHILNDIRLLASGPRAGLAELRLPDDGLSSSIMPGKRNATLAEALLQVCFRTIGNHATVVAAGASGLFELNVAKPVLIHAVLESGLSLADGMARFREGCLTGLAANMDRMSETVARSLMLATALTPVLGYDAVARVTRAAEAGDLSLRQACMDEGLLSGEDYDARVDPLRMAQGGLMEEP
ncbi:class II fumarate hydratase [Salipiger thiooxidans]|uniref:class II fumarate hydratase n=1 Tax=Salipiger thiooxidans TaxID=282683 RepID=UPI001CD32C82|nr:class II fumarate hydratase [Salipiger thiooxidans]MCA0850600.1 class II fumarate hydratase [Salipiger thiooxidans]